MTQNNNSNIFEDDEQTMLKPQGMTRDEILLSNGVFFLKDLVKPLVLDSAMIRRKTAQIIRAGENSWETIGVKRLWNHWIVRMSRFRHFYKEISLVHRVQPDWDANTCLSQKGVFKMSEVCELIPFSPHQIRYQCRKCPDSRTLLGVWKDETLQIYLVDMERFAQFIKNLWQQSSAPCRTSGQK